MIRLRLAAICLFSLSMIAASCDSSRSQDTTFEISGKIVDNRGQGIEGAQIISFSSREPNYAPINSTSDSDGNFSIAGPPCSEGAFQVLFHKEGYICEYAQAYKRERKPFVLQFVPEIPVVVEVVDKQGQPIEGATVAPHHVDFRGEFAIESIDQKSSIRLGLVGVTDAKGKAVLRGMSRSIVWAIRVDVPGHAPVYYQLPRSQIEGASAETIRLVWKSHSSKIKCTVKEADGSPATDAYLIFQSKEEDSNALLEKKPTPFTNIMRKLDDSGQVEVELSSPAVDIRSFSFRRGIAEDLGTFTLPNGESQDLDFELPPTCHILTTVLDLSSPESEPHEGIQITLRGKFGKRFQFATGITNEDGIADIEVAAGEWTCATIDGELPKDYVVDPLSFKITAESPTTATLAPPITIRKGRTIHGRIEGVDCYALRFDFIFCTYQSGLSEQEAEGRIQPDGTFTVTLPPNIDDSQITNFEITHSPVTNRRSLAIMSRKSWTLELNPDKIFGIGVALTEVDGKIRVAKVLPNGPASRFEQMVAGVELLSFADDEHPKTDLSGSTIEAAVDLIRGTVGSQLTLQIVPIGKGPEDAVSITLRRAAIPLE